MGARALPSRGSIENIPAELTTVSTHLETHARTNSKRGDGGFVIGFGWVCYRIRIPVQRHGGSRDTTWSPTDFTVKVSF